MQVLRISVIVLVCLVFVCSAGYLYASSGITSKPGYAQLDFQKSVSSRPMISLKLGPGGVQPARWLLEQISDDTQHNNEQLQLMMFAVLQDLQGLQLQVYEVNNNPVAFTDAITKSVASLQEKNWQPLISVKEDDQRIAVLQYGDTNQIEGISLMFADSENAVFMNLIGPFNPNTVADAASRLN